MNTAVSGPTKCPHCGLYHEATCPRIKAIEYQPNGMVKRIEFHGPSGPSPTVRLTADDLWDIRSRP